MANDRKPMRRNGFGPCPEPDRYGPPPRSPLPAGTHLVLSPGTGRPRPGMLTGGSPWRLMRVTAAADRLVDAWTAGRAVGDDLPARRLAGRLVDAGMAAPRPDLPGAGADPVVSVAVVVPVRDRPRGLADTLAALDPDTPVVVADDGSVDAGAVAAVTRRRPGTGLRRRPAAGGPGAARNTGWRSVDADVVAFVDADCIPPPGWLAALAGAFADPLVAAVAPRIRALPPAGGRRSAISAYEAGRSPLDLGPVPGPVRPRSRVPYVPSAALLVRRSALEAAGGFDEVLHTGEDVDLVWRLGRAGWRVRYDPSVVVGHPVRRSFVAWLRQRFGYGRSAAPLASRHGRAVAPLVAAPATAACWTLVVAGHPLAGAAVAAVAAGRLTASVGRRSGLATSEAARLAAAGQALSGLATAEALRRALWPAALAAAAVSRRARRAVLAAAVVPGLVGWWRARPPLGPLRWCLLALADDAAYGAGVWAGAWQARSVACLVPARAVPTRRRRAD